MNQIRIREPALGYIHSSNDCSYARIFFVVNLHFALFLVHVLGGLLACVPAHSDDSTDLEHHALPSIKLTLDWLLSNISTLHRPEVAQNSRYYV